jgi:hypothetical protein
MSELNIFAKSILEDNVECLTITTEDGIEVQELESFEVEVFSE